MWRKTFHSLSPGFQITASAREFASIMSLSQVEKKLLWTVCLELLPKIYWPNKKKFLVYGSHYACSDDDEWYFGVANYISVESYDVSIKFLQPNGPAAQFFRPIIEDTCKISMHDIILKVNPPSYGSTGRFYFFDYDEMNGVKKLMWFIWHPFPA